MSSHGFSPRLGVAIGLLAIVPAVVYALGRPSAAGYVAAINVVIIFAALYTAMSPVSDGRSSSGESA